MPVPSENDIQFVPVGHAKFFVDRVTDPNGDPPNVLDAGLGFRVIGRVSLPNWLEGKGHIAVYAEERGGPFNQKVGSADISATATIGEPKLKEYPWMVTIGGKVFPDPSKGSQLYHLAAVFTFGDQSTDIGAFVEMGPYLIN